MRFQLIALSELDTVVGGVTGLGSTSGSAPKTLDQFPKQPIERLFSTPEPSRTANLDLNPPPPPQKIAPVQFPPR